MHPIPVYLLGQVKICLPNQVQKSVCEVFFFFFNLIIDICPQVYAKIVLKGYTKKLVSFAPEIGNWVAHLDKEGLSTL